SRTSAGHACRDVAAYLVGRAYGVPALGEVGGDRVLDAYGLLGVPEVVQQERDREDRRRRVGLALARDVGRRAVHRLEHRRRGAVGVDVGRRGQADAAGDRGGLVGEDVTEEVVGHDDVEARRV